MSEATREVMFVGRDSPRALTDAVVAVTDALWNSCRTWFSTEPRVDWFDSGLGVGIWRVDRAQAISRRWSLRRSITA